MSRPTSLYKRRFAVNLGTVQSLPLVFLYTQASYIAQLTASLQLWIMTRLWFSKRGKLPNLEGLQISSRTRNLCFIVLPSRTDLCSNGGRTCVAYSMIGLFVLHKIWSCLAGGYRPFVVGNRREYFKLVMLHTESFIQWKYRCYISTPVAVIRR